MVLVARDLGNATMQTPDGIVGQHTIPLVLTGVKAASLRAAPLEAASALTPLRARSTNGQLSDDAEPRPTPRTTMSPGTPTP